MEWQRPSFSSIYKKHATPLSPNTISETKTIITKGETDPCNARLDSCRLHGKPDNLDHHPCSRLLSILMSEHQQERLGAFQGVFSDVLKCCCIQCASQGQVSLVMMCWGLNLTLPLLMDRQSTFIYPGCSHQERPSLSISAPDHLLLVTHIYSFASSPLLKHDNFFKILLE